MSLRSHIGFWIGAAALSGLFLYVFSGVLLPFVAGMALAYLLDPVADRLERIGLSRVVATSVILVVFVLLAILAAIVVVPILGHQLTAFIERIPDYVARLQAFVNSAAGARLVDALNVSPDDLKGSLSSLVNQGAQWLARLMTSLWNGGQALLSVMALLLVTPVVAFYMLLDWDHMVERIDSYMPREHRDTIRELARQMDQGVSNFVRGQVSVSLLLGLFYAIGLTLAGLNFGLLIGLFAGLISFVPYVGSIVGGLLAIGVAVVQFWPEWQAVAIIAAIFAAGQFLEGNILQPKLIGKSVGLHPVWLMFALFAFGALLGFVGMLIAVPAATAVAVLIRFALGQYLASPFYKGRRPPAAPASAPLPAEDNVP